MKSCQNMTLSPTVDSPGRSNHQNTTAHDSLIAVKLVCMSLICLIGVIGNILMCTTLAGHRRKSSEMFVLNLVITDLLVCGVSIPLDMYDHLNEETFPYGSVLCKIIWPSQTLLVLVSIMTLTAMAVERYRAIITPFKPKLKKMEIFKCIIAIWLLGLAVVSPYVKALTYDNRSCNEVWSGPNDANYYTLVLFVIDYCIPLTIISYCYVRVGLKLHKSNSALDASQQRGVCGREAHMYRLKRNKRIIKIFGFAVLMFVICMLPGDVYWLYKGWGDAEFPHEKQFQEFANILVYSNSMMNPFIFGSCNFTCIKSFCSKSKVGRSSYSLRFSFTSSFKRRSSKTSTTIWRKVGQMLESRELNGAVVFETNV